MSRALGEPCDRGPGCLEMTPIALRPHPFPKPRALIPRPPLPSFLQLWRPLFALPSRIVAKAAAASSSLQVLGSIKRVVCAVRLTFCFLYIPHSPRLPDSAHSSCPIKRNLFSAQGCTNPVSLLYLHTHIFSSVPGTVDAQPETTEHSIPRPALFAPRRSAPCPAAQFYPLAAPTQLFFSLIYPPLPVGHRCSAPRTHGQISTQHIYLLLLEPTFQP
jgi:hypothetical protein